MRAAPLLAVALAVGLTSCTSASDDQPSTDRPATGTITAAPADFAGAECPDDVSAVVVGEVTCGYLTVPEDRSSPGRDIRVFVARIEPPEVLHDDPMLVAGTDLANLPNYGGIAPLAQRVGREVIIMDPRGVGHSDPSLACPEVDELQDAVLAAATDDPGTRAAFVDAVADCHERLTASGVDPAAYDLGEMAADVESLRTALQIEEWNVVTYGTSSRIALEVVRQGSDHVRSVLLDSPEMPGTDPRRGAADGTRDALSAVMTACAADPGCARSFPDADTLVDTTLEMLAEAPVTVSMPTADEGSADVLVDDALLLRLLRSMLSDGGSSGSFMRPAAVPALLTDVANGRLARLVPTYAATVTGSPTYCLGYLPKCLPQHRASIGTALSVLCPDIAPSPDGEDAVIEGVDGPGYASAYAASPWSDACRAWPVAEGDPARGVGGRVESDVPVLAMVGAFSSYSPESVVGEGLSGLTDSVLVVDPAGGHNVMSSDCLVSIRSAWIDDLELGEDEQGCLADRATEWTTDPADLLVVAPAGAPDGTTTGASDAGLEGTWEADLSRAEMASALSEGGFDDLGPTFFASEGIGPDGLRTRTTFEDGRFSQAYQAPDGSWQVGWEAAATVRGRRVVLTDDVTGGTDILSWQVRGGRATFRPVDSTSALYKGISQMAYLWAYFAADAHRRAE